MTTTTPVLTDEVLEDATAIALAVALRGSANLEDICGFDLLDDLAMVLSGAQAYRALCELPPGHPGRDSVLVQHTRAERAAMEVDIIRDCAERHRDQYARWIAIDTERGGGPDPENVAEVARAERVLAALEAS